MGFEIAYIGDVGADYSGPTRVYLADGSNPMTADEWSTYVPPPGYIKNTATNVQFNAATMFTSPDSSTGKTYLTTSDGYTWLYATSAVNADWPFNPANYPHASYSNGYEAAAQNATPPPGVIRWTDNIKNQEITWFARNADGQPIERYFVTDPWGNKFIMQTSGELDPALVRENFLEAVLPRGWTKSIGDLKHDLTTLPAYDAQGTAHYYVFRDSSSDAFEQISWSRSGWGTSQMIAGMNIWGSGAANVIQTNPAHNNVVFGAGGTDIIDVHGLINEVHGDGGTDTVVFPGRRRRYTVTSDGSTTVVRLRGPASATHVTTLFDVERIHFGRLPRTTLHQPAERLFFRPLHPRRHEAR